MMTYHFTPKELALVTAKLDNYGRAQSDLTATLEVIVQLADLPGRWKLAQDGRSLIQVEDPNVTASSVNPDVLAPAS